MDNAISEVARRAVKEYLENLMNIERKVFLDENGGMKNGFYTRTIKTRIDEIEDLNVPTDREGIFRIDLDRLRSDTFLPLSEEFNMLIPPNLFFDPFSF